MDFSSASKLARRFLESLQEPFVGRQEQALMLTLALISGEHALMIGEPGTAKSALARRAAELLNARFFKYLLTRYTEPSELFGPLDLRALKEGKYVRITRGKLPEAEIAFLDEIFNANSAVLNTLLSLMQERIIYDGYTEINVPIWSVIGASNRVPEEPELEALYDRFVFRDYVRPLDQDYWDKLLDAAWRIEKGEYLAAKPVMGMRELEEIHKHLLSVDVTPVKPSLMRLFVMLEEKGMHVTDRRKGKILKAIAAHALLNGRRAAEETDLIVLKFTVPRDPEDFDKINIILMEELKTKDRVVRELEEIRKNIEAAQEVIERMQSFDPRLTDYFRNLKAARNRVAHLVKDIDDPEVQRLADEIIMTIDILVEEIMAKLNM
ncbi:MAG: MoxR family ATPase [Aeropyrum sp.]|nr:MoxR family ATPase [Aeropyrum sp.]MCE4616024.1 MoxR family ATPase [Aeropyrum sp.]